MKILSPYIRLMRLDKPVGVWLLFWPCAWALLLANGGYLDVRLFVLFAIGAVLMRSAGCVINDIIDRDIDKLVERTKTRPLASGELQLKNAIMLLAILLSLSLIIALMLGKNVVAWSAVALIPVAIYPFMKRVTWWPQLFLGLTFNLGAIIGWVAVRGVVEMPAILLYIGGIFWTLGYDTIYAIQDQEDDAKIGVRSTALRLGVNIKPFVAACYAIAFACFAIASGEFICAVALLPAAAQVAIQLYKLDINSSFSAKKVFLSNAWTGALITLSFVFK